MLGYHKCLCEHVGMLFHFYLLQERQRSRDVSVRHTHIYMHFKIKKIKNTKQFPMYIGIMTR